MTGSGSKSAIFLGKLHIVIGVSLRMWGIWPKAETCQ